MKFIVIVLFNVVFLGLADSETQTNWSGGPGTWGSVAEWDSLFFDNAGVDWLEYPGSVILPSSHTIVGEQSGSYMYPVDIDCDEDIDILALSVGSPDSLCWYENSDGLGLFWIKHDIGMYISLHHPIHSEDIDGDCDMDAITVSWSGGDVYWWENTDGGGLNWIRHTVDAGFTYPREAYSGDVDLDADMDILAVSYNTDDVVWFENMDGLGTQWTCWTLDSTFDGAYTVRTVDLDGDGDTDILGGAWFDGVAWWENVDGMGGAWSKHTISDEYGSCSIDSDDIDGDGDKDVVSCSNAGNLSWCENLDGTGTSWTIHHLILPPPYASIRCVKLKDMETDGDVDMVVARYDEDQITWWENLDGGGSSWKRHIAEDVYDGPLCVHALDFDLDGSMEILGSGGDEIRCWDLDSYQSCGSLESALLDTGTEPDWGTISWNASTPSGTAVGFQIRSTDTPDTPNDWSDTLWTPCNLEGILTDGERFVQYRVVLETVDSEITPTLEDVILSWNPVHIENSDRFPLTETGLLPFIPNPSASPVIRYCLASPTDVAIVVYNLTGHTMFYLRNYKTAGTHSISLENYATGVYFCRMTAGDLSSTQRFIVIH